MNYSMNQTNAKSSIIASIRACGNFVIFRSEEPNKNNYILTLKKIIQVVQSLSIEDAKENIETFREDLIKARQKGFLGFGKIDNAFEIMACNHALDCIRSVVVRFVTGTPTPDAIYPRREVI